MAKEQPPEWPLGNGNVLDPGNYAGILMEDILGYEPYNGGGFNFFDPLDLAERAGVSSDVMGVIGTIVGGYFGYPEVGPLIKGAMDGGNEGVNLAAATSAAGSYGGAFLGDVAGNVLSGFGAQGAGEAGAGVGSEVAAGASAGATVATDLATTPSASSVSALGGATSGATSGIPNAVGAVNPNELVVTGVRGVGGLDSSALGSTLAGMSRPTETSEAGDAWNGLADLVIDAATSALFGGGSDAAPVGNVSMVPSAPSAGGGGAGVGLPISNSTAPQIYPWVGARRAR